MERKLEPVEEIMITKVADHVKPGCIVYVYELRTINDASAKQDELENRQEHNISWCNVRVQLYEVLTMPG